MSIDLRMHRPAEERYRDELEALQALDEGRPKPPGWLLSPAMVRLFILGTQRPIDLPDGATLVIGPKFQGDPDIVEGAIATLASDRALLLVGPPGTAKSMLSEWLSAAISGSSRLIVQGSAGVTEDHVRYSWNYALLLKEGPTDAALKPSPILQAMREGKLVRVEEMTRCVSEVQDALISILSEKELAITEMDNRVVAAQRGFNVIATANTADRGVHEMSSALKRRFNFVNVPPVGNLDTEVAIVARRTRELIDEHQVPARLPDDVVGGLVRLFAALRGTAAGPRGQTAARKPPIEASSAQLISTLFDGCLRAAYFGQGTVTPFDVARSIVGSVRGEPAAQHLKEAVGGLLGNMGAGYADAEALANEISTKLRQESANP